MENGKTLTKPNKSDGNAADVPRLVEEASKIDPLGVMPDVGHLLPTDSASPQGACRQVGPGGGTAQGACRQVGPGGGLDLTGEVKNPEGGAVPLKNRKREEFCRVLTGWGGDGTRKRNCEAYEVVYGKGGATARTQSSWLLAQPDVRARVEYLERKVEEAKRHDYLAAQQEIDELRLGLVERGKKNSKLAAVALAAARDFEAAHGLAAKAARSDTVEVAAVEAGDGLGAVRAILAKVRIGQAQFGH